MKNRPDPGLNVFDEPIEYCGDRPTTGFFRDGACNTAAFDYGIHTVCAEMTQEFLEYSRFRGNDLMTPIPEAQFPGLKAGDTWCLCAQRWLEAYEHDMAPKVFLKRTHKRTLEVVDLETLLPFAVDIEIH